MQTDAAKTICSRQYIRPGQRPLPLFLSRWSSLGLHARHSGGCAGKLNACAVRTTRMENETPRDKTKHTLNALLDDLDQNGFKLTGALKTLVLSGREEDRLRSQGLGDPVYDATCLVCETAYEERLGGMLL